MYTIEKDHERLKEEVLKAVNVINEELILRGLEDAIPQEVIDERLQNLNQLCEYIYNLSSFKETIMEYIRLPLSDQKRKKVNDAMSEDEQYIGQNVILIFKILNMKVLDLMLML